VVGLHSTFSVHIAPLDVVLNVRLCGNATVLFHHCFVLPNHAANTQNSSAPSGGSVVRIRVAFIVLIVIVVTMGTKIVLDVIPLTTRVPGLMKILNWCDVSWWRLGLACVVHVLYSFALTAFGTIDWMVSDISAQQRYWRFWVPRMQMPHFQALSPGNDGSPSFELTPGCGRSPPVEHCATRESKAFCMIDASPYRNLNQVSLQPKRKSKLHGLDQVLDPCDISAAMHDKDLSDLFSHKELSEMGNVLEDIWSP